MTADSLTVLTCTPGHRCAKAYTEDTSQPPSAFDAGFLFSVESVPVADFAALVDALDALRAMPQCMVIRDQIRPGAQPNPAGLYARRRVDRPGDPAPFEHVERRYAMFDADATATAFDPADPGGSVERWRASLPQALQRAQLCFQFSAKQHLCETVRGHAWFWLSEPAGNVQLARWATRHDLDPAVFHAVQPLYTADPIFPEGVSDPLEPRALVVLEGEPCAEIDFTQEDVDAAALPRQNGQRLGSIALEEVGDPSDAPAIADARARLAKALARPFESAGKRWDLCGHVGGLCANAGIPPEECCGVLELLRAGDVADHDFGQGLRWALGAYSFSAKPLGIRGVKDLLGPVTAARVSEAAQTLAKALKAEAEQESGEGPALPTADWGAIGVQAFDVGTEPAPLTYAWRAPRPKH